MTRLERQSPQSLVRRSGLSPSDHGGVDPALISSAPKAKATWLPSGENAGSLSKPGSAAMGTTSSGGRAASARLRANRQIPIAKSKANDSRYTRYPPCFRRSPCKAAFAEEAVRVLVSLACPLGR